MDGSKNSQRKKGSADYAKQMKLKTNYTFYWNVNSTLKRVILRHNVEKLGGIYGENPENLAKLLSEKQFLGITADFLQFALEIRKTLESKWALSI